MNLACVVFLTTNQMFAFRLYREKKNYSPVCVCVGIFITVSTDVRDICLKKKWSQLTTWSLLNRLYLEQIDQTWQYHKLWFNLFQIHMITMNHFLTKAGYYICNPSHRRVSSWWMTQLPAQFCPENAGSLQKRKKKGGNERFATEFELLSAGFIAGIIAPYGLSGALRRFSKKGN